MIATQNKKLFVLMYAGITIVSLFMINLFLDNLVKADKNVGSKRAQSSRTPTLPTYDSEIQSKFPYSLYYIVLMIG